MIESEAIESDYDALNHGSDKGAFGLGFTDFTMRVAELWFQGFDSKGKRGIVPAHPYPTEGSSAALNFWLIRKDKRVRFQCWLMNKTARLAHVSMFLNIYCGGAVTADELEDTSGGEATMGMNTAAAAPTEVAAPNPPQRPTSADGAVLHSRAKKRKTKKSDIFDPLGGLFY